MNVSDKILGGSLQKAETSSTSKDGIMFLSSLYISQRY